MLQDIRDKGAKMTGRFIRLAAGLAYRFGVGNAQNPSGVKGLAAMCAMIVGSALVLAGGIGAIFTPLLGMALLAAGKMTLASGAGTALLTSFYGAMTLIGLGAAEEGNKITGFSSSFKRVGREIRNELKKELLHRPVCETGQKFDGIKTAKTDFGTATDIGKGSVQQKPEKQKHAVPSFQNKN